MPSVLLKLCRRLDGRGWVVGGLAGVLLGNSVALAQPETSSGRAVPSTVPTKPNARAAIPAKPQPPAAIPVAKPVSPAPVAPRAPRIIQLLPEGEKPAANPTAPPPAPPVGSAPKPGLFGTRARDRQTRLQRAIPRAESRNLLPVNELPASMSSPALSNLPRLGEMPTPPTGPTATTPDPPEKPVKRPSVPKEESTLDGEAAEEGIVGGRVTSAADLSDQINKSGLPEHAIDLVIFGLSTGDDLFRQGKFRSAEDAYTSALEYLESPAHAGLKAELQLRRGVALAESAKPGRNPGLGGDLSRASELLLEARDYWRDAKNGIQLALAETNLGVCLGYAGETQPAGPARLQLLRDSLEAFERAIQAGDPRLKGLRWAQGQRNKALALRNLAKAGDMPEDNLAQATACLREALPIFEKKATVSTWGQVMTLLAQTLLDQARLTTDAAARERLLNEALALPRRVIEETARRSLDEPRERAERELGNFYMVIAAHTELLALHPEAAAEAVRIFGENPEQLEDTSPLAGKRNLAMAAVRAAAAESDPQRRDQWLVTAIDALREARETITPSQDPKLYASLNFQLAEALGDRVPLVPAGERPLVLQQSLGAYTVAQEAVPHRGQDQQWAIIEVAKARQLLRYAAQAGGTRREASVDQARRLLENSRSAWMASFGLVEQAECFRMLAQSVIAQAMLAPEPDLAGTAEALEKSGSQMLALLRTARSLGEASAVEGVVFSALEQMEDLAYRYQGTRAQPLLRMVVKIWGGLAEGERAGLKEGAPLPETRLREAALIRESLGTAHFHLGYFSAAPTAIDDLGQGIARLTEAAEYWNQVPGQTAGQLLTSLLTVWLQQSSAELERGRRSLGPLRQGRLETARNVADRALQACDSGRASLGDDATWREFRRQFISARGDAERELALMLGTPETLKRLVATRDLLEELRGTLDKAAEPLAWVELTNAVGAMYTVHGRLSTQSLDQRKLLAKAVARHHQVLQEQEDTLPPEQLRATRLGLAEALVLLGPLERAANADEILNFSVSTFREAAESRDSSAFPLATAEARAGWAMAITRQARLLPVNERAAKLDEARLLVLQALGTLSSRNLPIAQLEALYLQAQLTEGEAGAETVVSALRAILNSTSARNYPELWARAGTLLQDVLLNRAHRPSEAYAMGEELLKFNPKDSRVQARQWQCFYINRKYDLLLADAKRVKARENDGFEPEDLVLLHVITGLIHLEAGRATEASAEFSEAKIANPNELPPLSPRYTSLAGVERAIRERALHLGPKAQEIIGALSQWQSANLLVTP